VELLLEEISIKRAEVLGNYKDTFCFAVAEHMVKRPLQHLGSYFI
jgi:hypothetical protein